MDVHNRLNSLLKQMGMTRYKLSKKCKISSETLTGIFTRGHTPTIATLEIICNGLGITLSQFFSEYDVIEMTPEIKELLEEWRFLTDKQRDLTIQLMKQMHSNENTDK